MSSGDLSEVTLSCPGSGFDAILSGPAPLVPLQPARCEWWGRLDYDLANARQHALLDDRIAGRIADTLLLMEHAPVYTMGTDRNWANLRYARERMPAPVVEVDRGGDVTFHGPGQLVAWPIVHLKGGRGVEQDVRWFVDALEGATCDVLAQHGIVGRHVEGRTGVWCDESRPDQPSDDPAHLAKVCAIGVKLRRWVTAHGLALNVNTDLRYFAAIVPCGIADASVTSMDRLTGRALSMLDVSNALRLALGERMRRDFQT